MIFHSIYGHLYKISGSYNRMLIPHSPCERLNWYVTLTHSTIIQFLSPFLFFKNALIFAVVFIWYYWPHIFSCVIFPGFFMQELWLMDYILRVNGIFLWILENPWNQHGGLSMIRIQFQYLVYLSITRDLFWRYSIMFRQSFSDILSTINDLDKLFNHDQLCMLFFCQFFIFIISNCWTIR